MRKRQSPIAPMQMVWTPKDYDDLERHAAQAIALTKERVDMHAAKRSVVEHAMSAHPSIRQQNPPCPVVDLFTRERLR